MGVFEYRQAQEIRDAFGGKTPNRFRVSDRFAITGSAVVPNLDFSSCLQGCAGDPFKYFEIAFRGLFDHLLRQFRRGGTFVPTERF